MFGMNEIVGVKFYKNAKEQTLNVTSRFLTLQGEGPYQNYPAYFLRLAKCNLACSFCDTYFDSGEVMSFDKIFEDVETVTKGFFDKRGMAVPRWASGDNRKIVLVVTGGEPSLQFHLGSFLERAQHVFYHTQIESNGTVPVTLPESTTYVVSPKCLEREIDGTMQAVRYLEPKKEMLARADCLKFVMSVPESNRFHPYSEVPVWAHEWREQTGKPIFVSPMNIYLKEPQKAKNLRASKQGTDITIEERSSVDETISFWETDLLDLKANQLNHEYTADYCMRHGFRFNLQVHLYASLP